MRKDLVLGVISRADRRAGGQERFRAPRRWIAWAATIVCGLTSAPQALSADAEPGVIILHDAAVPCHLAGDWRYIVGDRPDFADPRYDDSAWWTMSVPGNVPWPKHAALIWLRLHIRIPQTEPVGPLALRLGSIKFAYEPYFNGRKLGEMGRVGRQLRGVQPLTRPAFFAIPDELVRWGGDNVLAIRVAGIYSGGGLEGTDYWIGPHATQYRGWLRALMTSAGLTCLYLFIGVYHLFLYYRRREEPAYLYYGLLVLLASVYVLTNQELISLFYPSYELRLRIEVVSLAALTVVGERFLRCFFARDVRRLEAFLERAYVYCAFVFAFLVSFVLPVPVVFIAVNGLVYAILFAVFPYVFFIVIWARRRRLPGSRMFMFALAFFFLAALNDSFIALNAFHLAPRLFQLGFLGVVVAMALMLAEKFVTAHRTAERLNVKLEELVLNRTHDLAVANARMDSQNRELSSLVQQLQDQDKLKKDMIAVITHELRGPLSRLVAWSDWLEMDNHTSQEAREETASAIRRATLEMDAFVEDMLQVSRLEQAAIQTQLCEVALLPLIERILNRHRLSIEQHGLRANVAVSQDLPQVRTDPRLLRDVLENLISNAIKYTPDAGTIEVRTEAGNARWILEVADTGIGIPPEDQEKVFEKFFCCRRQKLPRSVHRSGVGLYTVAMYVRALGGQIRLHSEPDVGSTFSMEFPQPLAESPDTGSPEP